MKMVDIVSQTMPSESDVNVARNFLTKILRSSMRRNRKNRFKGRDEPAARPHSWHSAKLTDDHPDPPPDQSQDTGAPVWQAKHEARSSPKEVSSSVAEPTNQEQVSGQFNSVSSMERVERPSQPFPPGHLSPTNFSSSPEPHCTSSAPSRRESSLSCYSATSSPSDPAALPGSSSSPNADVVFYKGLQGEGARQGERPRYLQLPVGNGGWESPRSEEQPGSRFSSSGRSYTGPVWHVPERKKAVAPSPPPPPPPLRSDSFAATKVFPYSEGPGAHGQPKPQGRNMDRLSEDHRGLHVPHHEKGLETRRSYNPPPKKDFLHPNMATEDYNHNQLNPNKLFSLSSTDVRQSPAPYAYLSNHQRQYSDESTFYLQTARAAPPAKPQSVGSYYRSLQDLPTSRSSQSRSSTASLSSNAVDQNPDGGGGGGHIRYYCITAKQPAPQAAAPVWPGKGEGGGGWWGEAETTQWTGHIDRSSVSCQKAGKVKYPAPQSQLAYADGKERNGHFRPANGHLASALSSSGKVSSEEALRRAEGHSSEPLGRRVSHGQPSEPKVSPLRELQPDPWLAMDDQRICPKKTPLLHSLTQESRSLAERHPAADSGDTPAEPSSGKLARRSDRYATTLRNEVQQKRAQLQKSRSAATLTCTSDMDEEEEPEEWRSTTETTASPSDGSYSTTYKDHLKEAQARVLQATSFRRRDLEPHGAEPHAGRPHRIGGRKRFALDKRMHSFSEPDQINKVGVEGESRTGNAGSFVDRRKFFEMTATKPAFARPVPKQQGPSGTGGGEHREGKSRGRAPSAEPQDSHRPSQAVEPSLRPHHHNPDPGHEPGPLSPGRRQAMLEQQRLGTFAEYQATWSLQRRPSDAKKTQGRYHSAENILDPDVEDKHVCQHERSRSSPSADFYGQNLPVSWREAAEHPYLECRQDLQGGHTARGPGESGGRDRPAQPDQFPQSPESAPRDTTAPLASHHTLPPDPADHAHVLPPYPHNRSQSPGSEQPPQTKGPMPQRPHIGLETTSSSQEFLPGAQADPVLRSSPPGTQLDPAAPASGFSLGSTLAASLCPGRGTRLVSGRRVEGGAEEEAAEEEERRVTAEPVLLSTAASPPPPSSFSSSSKPAAAATLPVPSVSGTHSPSPQRLSDQPLLSKRDEAQSRPESVMEMTGAAKKLPVKIVGAESCSSERESCQYLLHNDSSRVPEDVSPPQLTHLGSSDHPHSRPHPQSHFFAYTHPGPHSTTDTHPAREQTPPGSPERDRGSLSADPPCSNGTSALGQGSEEDQKREELARDIMGKDKSLADILDQSKMKTTMDLMEGIFPQGEQLLEGTHQRRKVSPKHGSSRSTDERREEEGVSASVSLVPSSSYYSTSAPKAELLIKMKDMQERMERMEEEQDSEDELELNLAGKKQELILSLSRKLQVLREARESFQEDVADNNALGEEVEATVQQLCKPNELDKFRMFVGDLDKVVSLLLSLSGRLARVENALNSLEEDALPEEKRTLTEKRKLLILQHEDAKELKENLDRRERLVSGIMESHLSPESLADYQHFVKMKSALIIEQRKLEDKIKLGEEQLKCLTDSLPLEQRLLF